MRFRFSIRDLLWLTVLVAVLLAWWLDHRSMSRDRVIVERWQGQPTVGVPLVPIPPPAKIPVNFQKQSNE